jgi:hypothetical protein
MKRVMMIQSFDKLIVDPDFCPHLNVVTIRTGHQYTIEGEATDNMTDYDQCLDCGQVMSDDGQWRSHLPELTTSHIPY